MRDFLLNVSVEAGIYEDEINVDDVLQKLSLHPAFESPNCGRERSFVGLRTSTRYHANPGSVAKTSEELASDPQDTLECDFQQISHQSEKPVCLGSRMILSMPGTF